MDVIVLFVFVPEFGKSMCDLLLIFRLVGRHTEVLDNERRNHVS